MLFKRNRQSRCASTRLVHSRMAFEIETDFWIPTKHTDWSIDIGVETATARCIFQIEAHHWGSEQHSLVRRILQIRFLCVNEFIHIYSYFHGPEPTQPKKTHWFYRRYWGMYALPARYMAFALHWNHLLNCMLILTPWPIMRTLPNDCGVTFISNRKRKNFEHSFCLFFDPFKRLLFGYFQTEIHKETTA